VVYETAQHWAEQGYDVMFEGIISQDDVRRTVELNREHKMKVIALRVPLEECLAAIRERRERRGDIRPLNPRRTTDRHKSLNNTISRLKDSGVDCIWANREEALKAALEALGL
jgi:hypothetical protein